MMGMVFVCLAFYFQDIPLKPKEDYEIKFDLSFKARPVTSENSTVRLSETVREHERRTTNDPLPYLILHVKMFKLLPGEIRVKAVRDNVHTVFNKKTSTEIVYKLDVGFTDDIKDGISGYKHVLEFLSAEKKPISQVIIEFDKEGNYLVNGEKRGKI